MSLLDEARWRGRMEALLAGLDVPGAQFGVVGAGSRPEVLSAGLLDIETGTAVRDASLFQIGSLTKTWTAALALVLEEEGLLDLDAPVRAALPRFELADESAAAAVTVRELLTHTSGIDGDLFRDLGDPPDAVAQYVDALADADVLFEPGSGFSYSNAGYVVAGRVLEAVAGRSWAELVQRRLASPLGLDDVRADARVSHPAGVARGHVRLPEGGLAVARPRSIPAAMAPAGILSMSAASVLRFARVFLDGGAVGPGRRLLSPGSVRASLSSSVSVDLAGCDAWGLGWMLGRGTGADDASPATWWGHDGGTIGQSATLRLFPDEGVAVVVLTNGPDGRRLYRELVHELVHELGLGGGPAARSRGEAVAQDRGEPRDPDDLVGVYRDGWTELSVTRPDGALLAALSHATTLTGEPVVDTTEPRPLRTGSGRDHWHDADEGAGPVAIRFADAVGPAPYVHVGLRRLTRGSRPAP